MFKKRSTNIGVIVVILIVAAAGIMTVSRSGQGTKEWREVRTRVMPQFMPSENKEKIDILHKDFADDIDIGFVVDAESKYQFISPEMMEEWDVTQQMIEEQAMRNLEARSRNINVEVAQASDADETAKYVIVELDDGYAAVRLLSPGVRKAIARELGSEYIAAIPTRDFLIFWHTQFPLFDAFAKQVETEYNAEEKYPLSPYPFFVGRDGIEQMVRKSE